MSGIYANSKNKWVTSSVVRCLVFIVSITVVSVTQASRIDNLEKEHAKLVQAAKRGDANAQYDFASLISFSLGFSQSMTSDDYAAMVKWLNMAANQGHTEAQIELGQLYIDGRGVEQNNQRGLELFRQAAAKNDPKGLLNMGSAYHYGKGLSIDIPEAVKWYDLAAKYGDSSTKFKVATIYAERLPEEYLEYSKALKLFHQSAKQGHPKATFYIGIAYFKGDWGISENKVEAIKWIQKSARLGHERAQDTLKSLDITW